MKLPNLPIIRRKAYQNKWDKTQWAIILKHLSRLKSEKEFREFFSVFLPKKDRQGIIQKVVAYKRLRQGYKYREIESELGISRQSISSIKKAVEEGEYKTYNDRSAPVRARARLKRLKYLDKKASKPVKIPRSRTKYGRIRFPS